MVFCICKEGMRQCWYPREYKSTYPPGRYPLSTHCSPPQKGWVGGGYEQIMTSLTSINEIYWNIQAQTGHINLRKTNSKLDKQASS